MGSLGKPRFVLAGGSLLGVLAVIAGCGTSVSHQGPLVSGWATTATALTASPTSAVLGSPIVLTATITSSAASAPSGTVTFSNGTTLLGRAVLGSSGSATFTVGSLSPGANTITATYEGNPSFAKSLSSPLTVIITPDATATVLTASPTNANSGSEIALTATVTASSTVVPTGSVSFIRGTAVLGTAIVDDTGVATFTIHALPMGTNPITAQYGGTPSLAASTSPVVAISVAAPLPPGPKQSIKNWVTCDGVTDDTDGVAKAFAAARNNTFVLVVDCPVYMHVGRDVGRPVFIDNSTTVYFTQQGRLVLDNTLIPAFVIANTDHVTLLNWNIEYIGGLPINYTGGYYNHGEWFTDTIHGNGPGMVFNDVTLKSWLTANRAIQFIWGNPNWAGPTDTSSIFYVSGSSSDLDVENMKIWVPQAAGGDEYVPMAFALIGSQTSDQVFTVNTPAMRPYYALPTNLTFSGITLDGTYFGFQGSAQNMKVSNLVSYRYGDLQDANGGNVGGINLWFSPPHLLYLNYNSTGDPSLYNENIVIDGVIDYGQRTGAPRDFSSGNCYSLKLGEVHGSVSNYISLRPDGFMDVLDSTELTLTNISASYDSSFLSYHYPIVRFPGPHEYHDVTFTDLLFQDNAKRTDMNPIWGDSNDANTDIIFNSTTVNLNLWTGGNPPSPPYFAGSGNSVDVQITHQ